jgi:chromosomal replication initiation ATPase DnaA
MKNIKARCAIIHTALRQLIAEMEQIDLELKLMCNGRSCDILEIKVIQDMVADHYGLTQQVMLSDLRTEEYVNARGLAMYLARDLTFFGTREIAQCFGGRTHAIVQYSHDRIAERMSVDAPFAKEVQEIKRAAKSRIADAIKDRKAMIAEQIAAQPIQIAS